MGGMGGNGDLSMGFGAGATSIGEGGGATMEGLPTMMGGPMQMPGGMGGPVASMQGMQMPMGGAGSPSEGGLMSKQFIEGGEGGRFSFGFWSLMTDKIHLKVASELFKNANNIRCLRHQALK